MGSWGSGSVGGGVGVGVGVWFGVGAESGPVPPPPSFLGDVVGDFGSGFGSGVDWGVDWEAVSAFGDALAAGAVSSRSGSAGAETFDVDDVSGVGADRGATRARGRFFGFDVTFGVCCVTPGDARAKTSGTGAGCNSMDGTIVRVDALQSSAAPMRSTPRTRKPTIAKRTGRIMPAARKGQDEASMRVFSSSPHRQLMLPA